MCRAFYKYFLITSTSFMASAGLYFVCLTEWLWISPIHDYSDYDWRKVPERVGAACLVIFSVGLIIVLRARIRELMVYGVVLIIPLIVFVVILLSQLLSKRGQAFDLSDTFYLTVVIIFLAIIVHIFLFAHSLNQGPTITTIKRRRRTRSNRENYEMEVRL